MFGKHILALLILATVLHSSQATFNVTAVCTLMKPGTKVASTVSCTNYYVCSSNGGYKEESCDASYSFDKNRQTCLPSEDVNCYYGMPNPCINAKSPSFVQAEGCGAYSYCVDQKVAGKGNCPTGQVFKDGVCMYGSCSTESQKPGMDLVNVCEVIPENMYVGTTFSCDQYQSCPAGKAEPVVGTCDDDLYFDVKLGLCNYKEATDCSRVTGENLPGTGGTGVEACLLPNGLKPNHNKCSGYFKCDGQKWVPLSCGSMYWDVLTKTCQPRQRATPFEDCDRCEGARGQFVNAVNENCAEYLICSNNKKVATSSCQSGYFDEAAQVCVSGGNVTEYAAKNGACYKAPGCRCGAPDSKTGRCTSTADCKCGINGFDKKKCVVCTDPIDPNTGICQNGACDCEKRGVNKCAAADDCKCGIDAKDKTKCITCDKELDDQGVCGTAPAPACDCNTREVAKCSAKDGCNCGLDVKDKTKCITCDAKDLDEQGVCGTAPAPACECDTREVASCSAKDGCNCGLDVKDKTKCITCDAKDLDEQGVCGTAPAPACDCDTREVASCSAKDGCNCGLDVKDKTKCITCDAKDLDEQGVCGTAPAPACDCDTREVASCSAKDGCNCGLDVKDKTKCITCDAKDLDEQGVCGTAPAPACDCDTREVASCSAKDGCNCGLDVKDKTKCITCDAKDLDEQGVCGTAPAPACDCDTREVASCSAKDGCNCGLDVKDKTKCITCDAKELDEQGVCGTA